MATAPVRSLESEPEEVGSELPESLITQFKVEALIQYRNRENPIVAQCNEAMERMLHADKTRSLQEGLEEVECAHWVVTQFLVENTDLSHDDIVEYTRQRQLSEFVDDDIKIQGREQEIASSIDRDSWNHFKRDAYNHHGWDDDAVIRHIKDAMILILVDPAKSELEREKNRKVHIMERLAELVNEYTEYTVELKSEKHFRKSWFEN